MAHSKVLGVRLREYTLVEEIGGGAFGRVYLAKTTSRGKEQFFAIKRLLLRKHAKQTKQELMIANKLPRHENVVTVHDFFFNHRKPRVYLVLEYCEAGDLNEYVLKTKPATPEIAAYMVDITKGLQHLHVHKVIHRDIKPQNILLKQQEGRLVAKIADFSIAKIQESRFFMTRCGTIFYQAPEITAFEKYTFSADVYSLGLLFFVIFTGISVEDDGKTVLAPIIHVESSLQPIFSLIRKGIDKQKFMENYFMKVPELGGLIYTMIDVRPEARPRLDSVLAAVAEIKGSVQSRKRSLDLFVSAARRVANMASITKHLKEMGLRNKTSDSGLGSLAEEVRDGAIEVVSAEDSAEPSLGDVEEETDDIDEGPSSGKKITSKKGSKSYTRFS